jgi:hypothetical protein
MILGVFGLYSFIFLHVIHFQNSGFSKDLEGRQICHVVWVNNEHFITDAQWLHMAWKTISLAW